MILTAIFIQKNKKYTRQTAGISQVNKVYKMKKTIDYATYLDRILGGWIGKSLGGIVGAPYECHKQFNKAEYDNLWPSKLYPNDDLDIQVVWLEALQKIGIAPTSRQLAEFWKKNCFYVCCEYGVFIDNIEHGIYPPLSGLWDNDFFKYSEGCPIRSEIWGFIAPGNPALAMEYAAKDGCLDHGKVSIELEQFLSAAASLAFFENDPVELFEKCCQVVPEDNAGRLLYIGVKELCEKYQDERELWLQIVRKYGVSDSTNALINNAFAMMALFRGGNDFKEIMRLCVQIGWDVDCSCATAGALWGALHGSKALPQDWCERMGKTLVCACEIEHKNAPLTDFAAETAAIGLEVAQVLNKDITITGAPQVKVRPLPAPEYDIAYSYKNDEPVLWGNKETEVMLNITNPFAEEFSGCIDISFPAWTQVDSSSIPVCIPAGKTASAAVRIRRADGVEMVPEKSLFTVTLKQNGKTVLEDTFGLHTAASYKVYGPYWDMWDKDLLEICPYQNEELTCNPGNLPEYSCDAVNCHVRPHHAYLDEKALLEHDLPEESPFIVEKAVDRFSRSDLYSFDGASCCYLVREFQSDEVMEDVSFSFFADCPFECYLDGKLIKSAGIHSKMNSLYGGSPAVTLTGKKQRIVIKLASRLDQFHFKFNFFKPVPSFKEAFSPYVRNTSFRFFN